MTPDSDLIVRLQQRIELARYAHLPVGMLADDWILGASDTLFARCLREAGHLLWAVDGKLPDVSGQGGADSALPSAQDMASLDSKKRAEVSHDSITPKPHYLKQYYPLPDPNSLPESPPLKKSSTDP